MAQSTDKALTLKDLRFTPPTFPEAQLLNFAEKTYGLTGTLKPLKGERDQNHKLTTADGKDYVLKIAGSDEDPALVDFQVQALLHIEQVAPDLSVPRIIPTLEGCTTAPLVGEDGETHLGRLLSYIPGVPLGDGDVPSLKTLREIGTFQGKLCKAFNSFHHPASKLFMPWDISNGLVLSPSLKKGALGDVEELVVPLLDHFKDEVFPALKLLRQQVIHNDGHQGNLLRSAKGVDDFSGIIDFGDLVYAPLIDDLAVSIDGIMGYCNFPIEAGEAILAGFNEQFPLRREEVKVLFDLCMIRGALTIQLFDFRITNLDVPNELDLKEYPEIINGFKANLNLDKREVTKRWLRSCNL
jgi:Ser/Thr protein kinase RdoA (MazF antagonist)